MYDAITEGLAAGTEQGKPAAKPAAKEGEAEAGPEIDPATGKPKVKEPVKAEEPLYKMPDGLQAPARQRFQALVEGHRKVATELEATKASLAKVQPEYEAVVARQNAFRDILKETQTAPEELNMFLTFNQLVKTKQYEKAIPILKEQLRLLSIATGKNEGGDLDPLSDFPDLKAQVDEHRITEQAALELARARLTERSAQAERTRVEQTRGSEQQAQQAWDDGVKAVQTWSNGLNAKDLDYKAKEPKMLEMLDEVMEKYPPQLWVTTLQALYKTIVIPKAARGNGAQPLRPSGGGGTKAPATMAEAIAQGLGYAK
jgi:hypothetical protein